MPTLRKLPLPLALLALAFGLWYSTNPTASATGDVTCDSAPQTPPAIRLSSDGAHLVDAAGEPFFLNGDSAWSLIAQLSREDVELYLENRRRKGVNAVLVNLIEHSFASKPPKNRYGDAPFLEAGRFDTPNERYFAHADWVINRAAEKGIAVLLAPIYLGYDCGKQGWCAEVKASRPAALRRYGRYIGRRYRNFPNLIWVVGGDADPAANGAIDRLREFTAGLKECDSAHLVTAHNGPEQASADVWTDEKWLDLNGIYTYRATYREAQRQYNRGLRKPIVLMESAYEGEHESTPLSLRSQAYWSVLSGGASGHLFGNFAIWNFGYRGAPWKRELESPGSRTLPLVGRLFRSRAFHKLVPDLNNRVLTAGYGTGNEYAAAAITSDGDTIIAYIPTRRTVTMDLTTLSGRRAKAWWFNPRTADAKAIGVFPVVPNQPFTPPDSNDWVLVVDNAAPPLATPGSPAGSAGKVAPR